jgi:hypothetical protein
MLARRRPIRLESTHKALITDLGFHDRHQARRAFTEHARGSLTVPAFTLNDHCHSQESAVPIFLSHSAKDRGFVEKLALDLTQRRFRVWRDTWHIGIGEHITDSVREAVTSSAFLVVVLSRHTSKSKWVSDELDWATTRERERNRKILLPVRIGGGEVPRQIRERLYADFTDSYSDGLRNLESRLKSWGPAIPAPFDIADVDIPIFLDDGLDVDVHALGQCLDRQLPVDEWWPEGTEPPAAKQNLRPAAPERFVPGRANFDVDDTRPDLHEQRPDDARQPSGLNRAGTDEIDADAAGRILEGGASLRAPKESRPRILPRQGLDIVFGTGIQTARALLDAGRIGDPVSAAVHWTAPGPALWNPPHAFYKPGGDPLFDMGRAT